MGMEKGRGGVGVGIQERLKTKVKKTWGSEKSQS